MAGSLIQAKLTGYCTTIRKVIYNVKEWEAGAIPLLLMTDIDNLNNKIAIPYQKIDINGDLFKKFAEER